MKYKFDNAENIVPALRVVLIAGSLLAVGWPIVRSSWEARLILGNSSWIIDMGRHPAWEAPPAPSYSDFQQHFIQSGGFPPPNAPWTMRMGLKWESIVLESLLYLWPVTVAIGLLYLIVRGPVRDVVLHCVLCAGAGLTLSVGACIAFWCVIGGWGAPMPILFGMSGLIGGLLGGVVLFHPKTAERITAPDGDERS
jgi:hypothetical protein